MMEKRKSTSRMAYFKKDIEALLKKGVSISETWKIINMDLPDYAKISYNGFYKYVKRNIDRR